MRVLGLLTLIAIFFAGCSGAGGVALEGQQLGSVALVLSEQTATEDEASVHVTFTEVALLPAGGGEPVVLFESAAGEELDLLDDDFLLSVSEGIPPGRYDGVRLGITAVRFEGGDCGDVDLDLPGGSLTLEPEEAIAVVAGDTVVVRIELDLDMSMDTDETTGQCTFRPVARIEVEKGDSIAEECPREVFGTVEAVRRNDADAIVGGVLALGAGRGELAFALGEATAFFDGAGEASDASEIGVGARLTVKGRLGDDGVLRALVVVAGETLVVEGKIDSTFAEGVFVLLPDRGEEVVGATDVAVADGTLLLLDCAEGSADDLRFGARVTVTGKLDAAEGVLRAVCVRIEPSVIEGRLIEIAEADGGGFELTVRVDGEADDRTILAERVQLAGDGTIPFDLLQGLLECAPRPVVVHLDPDDLGTAVEVRVGSEDFAGVIADVNASTRRMTVGETLVAVQADATILDLRGGQELASLGDLEAGDRVRVFGLDACETDDVAFHAFVVLILPREVREPEDDGECGFGQGYWKNHTEAWPDRLTPDTPFAEVFGDRAFGDATLLQVLQTGGGGLVALGRHVVAALLNAASEEIDYPLDVEEVIDAFADRRDVESLKNELERLNERFCPLHGDDGEGESENER